jgi:hypothetical protein
VEINVSNDQLVGVNADDVVVMFPKQRMSKAEALRHAAWLVVCADSRDEFAAVLAAVQNT